MLLPLETELELYCEPNLNVLFSGQNYSTMYDYSGKNRHLTAASNPPLFSTPAVNGKAAAYWDGTHNPLKNTAAAFTLQCGFIVAKYNAAAFAGFNGLLTDLENYPLLVGGGAATTNFYDFLYDGNFYEFRSNDKIYSRNIVSDVFSPPAPINAYKIIFFRFWKPITINGIQLGQDRNDASRKWNGFVAFLALYSRNFTEPEIRSYSQILSDNFNLPLADVYPYQADTVDTPETSAQTVNFYDPPEGDRISEALGSAKRNVSLKFSGSDQTEVKAMRRFHAQHYAPASPCIYRDYRMTPPEDIEGYIDSPYSLDGSNNDFTYGFKFKER